MGKGYIIIRVCEMYNIVAVFLSISQRQGIM